MKGVHCHLYTCENLNDALTTPSSKYSCAYSLSYRIESVLGLLSEFPVSVSSCHWLDMV
jgi:hypothetical protein